MLQLLYLDISKVDRVLHMWCTWEMVGGADNVRDGVGDFRGSTGPPPVIGWLDSEVTRIAVIGW